MSHRTFAGDTIFIGGDGRSGTTLLSVILDSHPDLAVAPELHFKGPEDLGRYVLECIELLEHGDARVSGKNLSKNPDIKPGVQFVHRAVRAGVSKEELRSIIIAQLDVTKTELATFADRCAVIDAMGRSNACKAGKKRWGLKIMREIRDVRRYASVWPKARFIHIIRDGRDVAASQILEHSSWGYGDIERAAAGWIRVVRDSRENSKGIPMHEVRYEDLIADPETTLRAVLEFLDARWDDAVLRHHEMKHALFETTVRHPSTKAVVQAINPRAVGRYQRDLTAQQIETFNEIASDYLSELGYALSPRKHGQRTRESGLAPGGRRSAKSQRPVDVSLPAVPIHLQLGTVGCWRVASCSKYVRNIRKRLVGRYIAEAAPFEGQVPAGWLDLRDLTHDEYVIRLKKRYKGNVIRDARKADKQGFVCEPFARKLHIPDIVAINHSKDQRCGKPMRAAYLKSVEDMGGEPQTLIELTPPQCPNHYDIWWGIFSPEPGYRQGNVVTNKRLLAYIDFRRVGNFALYSLIIGHGDHLKHGIMYRLHFAIMEWICRRDLALTNGLDHLVYAGFYQGGEGLRLWKKKTLFEPAYLLLAEQAARPKRSGVWARIRSVIR